MSAWFGDPDLIALQQQAALGQATSAMQEILLGNRQFAPGAAINTSPDYLNDLQRLEMLQSGITAINTPIVLPPQKRFTNHSKHSFKELSKKAVVKDILPASIKLEGDAIKNRIKEHLETMS